MKEGEKGGLQPKKLAELYASLAVTFEDLDQAQDAIENYEKEIELLQLYDAAGSSRNVKIFYIKFKIFFNPWIFVHFFWKLF